MNYPKSPLRIGGGPPATVTAVQTRLRAWGIPDLSVDGVFGPDTEAAVKLFQARSVDTDGRPLEIDGVLGPMTWAALFLQPVTEKNRTGKPLLSAVLRKAASQVGVMEQPPGSNAGPEVGAYLASIGLNPGYAWCAAFVYWCFKEAAQETGEPNPCPRTGGVHDLWNKVGKAGLTRISPSQLRAKPELAAPGQLFFLDSGGGLGHVGFVEAVQGVNLTTIEGNTNEGGSRNGVGVFRRTRRRITDINLGVAALV